MVEFGAPRPATSRQPLSALEAELAERLGSRQERMGGFRRPSRSELQAAKRRVRQRLEQTAPSPVTQTRTLGVGSSLWRTGQGIATGRAGSRTGAPTAGAPRRRHPRQPGRRIRCVELGLALSQNCSGWRCAAKCGAASLCRGWPGVQFALPEVVEQLRALAEPVKDEEPFVVMNACDPANLYGAANAEAPQTAADAPLTFARIPSTWLVLNRGLPVLLVEDGGARMTTVAGAGDDRQRRAVEAWLAHVATFEHRVQVTGWNGEPVLNSAGQHVLEAAGFHRDYPGMSWET